MDEQRFRFAVTALLLQIIFHGRAPVMPNESAGAETNFVSLLLQTPTDIDVVAGFPKNGIEAADVVEGPFVKGHVAAGNMFGEAIGQHHVGGAARRSHYAGGDPGIIRRQKIVTADARKFALQQIAN